ncbi:MAG: hypothetical protein R3A49_12585 [Acidimicrobiia bacterium]
MRLTPKHQTRWIRLAVGSALVALVAAACIPQPPPPVEPPEPPEGDICHSMSIGTCALPFPSNEWTVPDASSPTRIRLAVPDGIVPDAVMAELPASFTPTELFNSDDGFSAAGPVVFELPTSLKRATLPDDGGNAVVVYDLTTGERADVRVHEYQDAANRGRHGTIVQAWSRTHWEWGHTYVAAVTTQLGKQAGGTFDPAPAGSGDAAGRSFLAGKGFDADDLVSLTTFTVRSEADATDDIDAMAAEVRAQEHPVRSVKALPNFLGLPGVSTVVTGQVRTTDFRNSEGQVRFEPGDTGKTNWVDFTMTVPSKRLDGGSPVAIYGHGLGIFKESLIVVAGQNAHRGVATISIDQPNHGSRQGPDGGYIFELTRPSEVDRLTGIIEQSPLDHLSLMLALPELADLDVAPFNLFDPLAADGVADLETGRVLYEGTSLGGVLGTAFVSIAPELEGAAVQVAGVGITSILSGSIFWEIGINSAGVGFKGVVPRSATAGEAAVLTASVQHELDDADAINLVERIPENGTPMLDLYAMGDGLVPNYSSEAFARLAQLPQYDRVLKPIPGVPHAGPTLPADGTGIWQIDTGNVPQFPGGLSVISDLLEHVSFVQNRANAQLTTWIDDRLAATP